MRFVALPVLVIFCASACVCTAPASPALSTLLTLPPSPSHYKHKHTNTHTALGAFRSFSSPSEQVSYPSRSNIRPIPVAKYPASDLEPIRFDHVVEPATEYPVAINNGEEAKAESETEGPTVFAVVDINTKQVKVTAGAQVMTDNLSVSARAEQECMLMYFSYACSAALNN